LIETHSFRTLTPHFHQTFWFLEFFVSFIWFFSLVLVFGFFTGPWSACEVVVANKISKIADNKDNNNSPTHRAITINDIRLARVNNTSTGNGATTSGGGQSSSMLATGNNNNNLNVNNNQSHAGAAGGGGGGGGSNSTSTIITIKQEAMGSNVDNLVGNFVDSTTFLHSPNSQQQMVNPNLVQSTAPTLGGATGN
jgi:hypothetical protein